MESGKWKMENEESFAFRFPFFIVNFPFSYATLLVRRRIFTAKFVTGRTNN